MTDERKKEIAGLMVEITNNQEEMHKKFNFPFTRKVFHLGMTTALDMIAKYDKKEMFEIYDMVEDHYNGKNGVASPFQQ